MANEQLTTRGVSPTDQTEKKSQQIFESKLPLTDALFVWYGDKNPNLDGHIEFLGKNGSTTVKMFFQLKSSEQDIIYHDCDRSFLNYCYQATEPTFLVFANIPQQKVEQIVKEAFRFKSEAEDERREASQILGNTIKEFFVTDNQKTFWKWSNDIEIIKTLEPNFWKKTVSSKKHLSIKFGDIFNYQKGTEVGSALYQDNGIPFLRVSDLGDLEIQFGNSSKCINETLFDELKDEFQPHKGELLFSKDATIGLVAKVEIEEKQIISSGILRLKIKNKDFDPDFLIALLTNKFINQEFVKNSTGSVIKHLNTQKLSEIELPLIDKQIQNKVSDKIKSFLSKRQVSRQKLQEAKDFVENLVKRNSE